MAHYRKTIVSGDYIETFNYEKSPSLTKRPRKRKEQIQTSFGNVYYVDRRLRNLKSTRRRFIRLVRSNTRRADSPALLTLTMREITSLEVANAELNRFIKRLRYALKSDVSYIGVPEFQRRGAVHYHLLIWGIEDRIINTEKSTRFIAQIWGLGFIDIKSTDGSNKLAGYLSKYMTKAIADERLVKKKAYCFSRNVLRPETIINTPLHQFTRLILGVDNELVHESSYDTVYLGRCDYKLIKLLRYGN